MDIPNFLKVFESKDIKDDEKDLTILYDVEGQITHVRIHGQKTFFYTIESGGSSIQIMSVFNLWNPSNKQGFFDQNPKKVGDNITVRGFAGKTKTGFKTIFAHELVKKEVINSPKDDIRKMIVEIQEILSKILIVLDN